MYILWAMIPQFPEFKPVEIGDRDFMRTRLWEYQPETSELNFTNLFIWRNHYGLRWSTLDRWILVIGENTAHGIAALPPIGPGSRLEVTRALLKWMADGGRRVKEPRIDRADQKLVSELADAEGFDIQPVRDHFDYVYQTKSLVELNGKNYRAKRNHLNYLFRTYPITYEPMEESHIQDCLKMADEWCEARRCQEDLNLESEWGATREALLNFKALGVEGGVVRVGGKVEAFTLGELLNSQTAVVHIEKANMEVRGLYAVINQQFCEKRWRDVPLINREQDLGEPGLRRAKLSYSPDQLIDKFRIALRS
jgi:uncharacterized protein